ncbi:MAG: SCO family protein, partial [Gammaproteobacteria bacterium]|nr:SCO family protein [Gammaproteobacteria bacterium]
FGYTHCPDVCPVTLSVLKAVKAGIDGQGGGGQSEAAATQPELKNSQLGSIPIQYVFVTVDPDRDTPAHMRDYLAYFDPQFIGLHGSKTALDGLYRQLGVLALPGEPDANGSYLVDHTAGVMLIDPKARLLGIFQAPHEPTNVRERFDAIRAFYMRVAD